MSEATLAVEAVDTDEAAKEEEVQSTPVAVVVKRPDQIKHQSSCQKQNHQVSQRLAPSSYKEAVGAATNTTAIASSSKESPALRRARMAVARGREFRRSSESGGDGSRGCQSDDEVAAATRTNDLMLPPQHHLHQNEETGSQKSRAIRLPKPRPSSAMAGRLQQQRNSETPADTKQQLQTPQQQTVVPRQQQHRCLASLNELFAKYPSMQSSFKLLPPHKQQEQWSRLFDLLESQQAAFIAKKSSENHQEVEQLKSRVRSELTEERLRLDQRLANHSRLVGAAVGGGLQVPATPFSGATRKASAAAARLPSSQAVANNPIQHPTSAIDEDPRIGSGASQALANLRGVYESELRRLRQRLPPAAEPAAPAAPAAGASSAELESRLHRMDGQLAAARRERDHLREQLDAATGRMAELLAENDRLRVQLDGLAAERARHHPPEPPPPLSLSTPPQLDSAVLSEEAAPSWRDPTVAALRRSLAELERRNLIDSSPTRRPDAGLRERGVSAKVKHRRSSPSQHQAAAPAPMWSSRRSRVSRIGLE